MNSRDKRAFDFVIDKIRTKLSAWKAWSLSLAGRLTLVNFVTSAIPTHIMQCNLLPTWIYNELDRINRNFLWGDATPSKKMHVVNWEMDMLPKHLGSLGIKKSMAHNKALLAKRAWALHTNFSDFYAETLRKKYPITSNTTKRKSLVWSTIWKAKAICEKGTRWLIRNGETTHFWLDDWTGHRPLRNLLHGHLHTNDLSLKVKDTWDNLGNWLFSNLSFKIPLQILDFIQATPKPFSSSLSDLPT